MIKKCKVAVVGVGYLGQYHAEKFAQLPHAELVAVCDAHPERAHEIAAKYQVRAVTDYRELFDLVDAVSIVVQTSAHHTVAKDFLTANKHVLLEKPITRSIEEANDLIQCARAQNLVLQIGHLERFNPVVREINALIDNPRFIECVRVSPYKPRVTDINVIHDVMIHDIDLILQWVNSPIKSIAARGTQVLTQRIDFANARIEFQNGCSANLTASRVSAKSQREIRLFQHNAYIEADLQLKKLSIHHQNRSDATEIAMQEQSFEAGDALRDECEAFLSSIINKTPPKVSAEAGRSALITALDITRIIAEQLANEHTGTQANQPWIQDA
jgi:predicted dehydrogenase